MDPKNSLWLHLIFVRCTPNDLPALRLTCRGFLAQLMNPSHTANRLWVSLTVQLPWLCHGERILGWQGLRQSAERIARTRVNCDAGTCKSVAIGAPPGSDAMYVRLVGNRIFATYERRDVVLFDKDTGTVVASFCINGIKNVGIMPILDRWIYVICCDGMRECVVLVDCVEASRKMISSWISIGSSISCIASGPCLSIEIRGDLHVLVKHTPWDDNGRESAIKLDHACDSVTLCEDGRSYLYYGSNDYILRLMDLETQQPKRVFAPPSM